MGCMNPIDNPGSRQRFCASSSSRIPSHHSVDGDLLGMDNVLCAAILCRGAQTSGSEGVHRNLPLHLKIKQRLPPRPEEKKIGN